MPKNKKIESLENLEEQGYRLVDIAAGDVNLPVEKQYVVAEIKLEKRGTFYSDLVNSLTSQVFEESVAKQYWQEILMHKYLVSEKLSRNIGIRVAALDYLENIKRIIKTPRIVSEKEYSKTVKLATTDTLTGLYNRHYFLGQMEGLENEYRKLAAQAVVKKFCVMLMDMDNFKKYNDTEGHPAGDIVLHELASVLTSVFRKDETLCRWGGDEFIVLLPDTDKHAAKVLAEELRQKVVREFKDYNITLSIGLAEFLVDAGDSDSLVERADELLYRVKEFGGNKVAAATVAEFVFLPEAYKFTEKIYKAAVTGDFNAWDKRRNVLKYDEIRKVWNGTVVLKPGNYRYKFVVNDSKWFADTGNNNQTDDGFGGQCSVITIEI
ncbi:MAG: diguanylate cyclase [Elusimicrobiota bacterium]